MKRQARSSSGEIARIVQCFLFSFLGGESFYILFYYTMDALRTLASSQACTADGTASAAMNPMARAL